MNPRGIFIENLDNKFAHSQTNIISSVIFQSLVLDTPITVINLTQSSQRILRKIGVSRIGDFILLDLSKVGRIKGVGSNTCVDLAKARDSILKSIREKTDENQNLFQTNLWIILKEHLSVRTKNGLDLLSINSLTDFLSLSRNQFLSLPYIGLKSWYEVSFYQKRILSLSENLQLRFSKELPQSLPDHYNYDEKYALNIVREYLHSRGHILDSLNVKSFSELMKIEKMDVIALHNVGEATWNKLQEAIKSAKTRIVNDIEHGDGILLYKKLRLWGGSKIEISKIPENFYPLTPISEIPFPQRCKSAFNYLEITRLGEILNTHPKSLMRVPNFGVKSLKNLRTIIINYFDYKKENNINNYFIDTFSSFIKILCENANIPQEHTEIIIEKLFGNDGNTLTLKKVGIIHNLTRERIRQIIKSSFSKIMNNYKNENLIKNFRSKIFDTIFYSGGLIDYYEAGTRISALMKWSKTISKSSLTEYLNYADNHKNIKFNENTLSVQVPCLKCHNISNRIKDILQSQKYEKISYKELSFICDSSSNPLCPDKSQINFSKAFLKQIAKNSGLKCDHTYIYPKQIWDLKRGGLSKKVSSILYFLAKPSSLEEICEYLKVKTGNSFNLDSVHVALLNSHDCILWGRTIFYHVDCI